MKINKYIFLLFPTLILLCGIAGANVNFNESFIAPDNTQINGYNLWQGQFGSNLGTAIITSNAAVLSRSGGNDAIINHMIYNTSLTANTFISLNVTYKTSSSSYFYMAICTTNPPGQTGPTTSTCAGETHGNNQFAGADGYMLEGFTEGGPFVLYFVKNQTSTSLLTYPASLTQASYTIQIANTSKGMNISIYQNSILLNSTINNSFASYSSIGFSTRASSIIFTDISVNYNGSVNAPNFSINANNFFSQFNLTNVNQFDYGINFTENYSVNSNISFLYFERNITNSAGATISDNITYSSSSSLNINRTIDSRLFLPSTWYNVILQVHDNVTQILKNYRFYYPLHKIIKHTLNESRNNIPFTISTLNSYMNLSTELTGPTISYTQNNSGILSQLINYINIIPNILYNYVNLSPPILAGNISLISYAVANCPTCTVGYAVTSNSSTNNLTVYNIFIDNCSSSNGLFTPNATALNVSFFNVNNQSISIKYQSTTMYLSSQYSLTLNNLNPQNNTAFCIYPSWANISVNTQFLYTDTNNNIYNYFLSGYLNNNTQRLNLFTNNGTTQITFNLVNSNGINLVGYKIQILQYNIGTGTYTTTEILQTDSNGNAIGNIVLLNAYYNFIVYDTNNNLIQTFTGIRVTSTPYTLTVSTISNAFFSDSQNAIGVFTNISFNNLTNNFVYIWSNPTGASVTACINVQNYTYLGWTTMSNSCAVSAAGTIIYNINPQNGTRYVASGYLNYNGYNFQIGQAGFSLPDNTKLFNVDQTGGLFAGVLLLIVGILIAMPNAVIGIIYFILVLIGDVLIGLFNFTDAGTTMGIGIMSSIAVLGLFVIYIGGKQQ